MTVLRAWTYCSLLGALFQYVLLKTQVSELIMRIKSWKYLFIASVFKGWLLGDTNHQALFLLWKEKQQWQLSGKGPAEGARVWVRRRAGFAGLFLAQVYSSFWKYFFFKCMGFSYAKWGRTGLVHCKIPSRVRSLTHPRTQREMQTGLSSLIQNYNFAHAQKCRSS